VLTRVALGYENQGEFAREAGIEPQTYNPWENDSGRTLSLRGAMLLCARYKLTLDWLFNGVPDQLPHALAMKLREMEADKIAPPARSPRRPHQK
jgi:transcriptional regulator with XRE-family HTH domain